MEKKEKEKEKERKKKNGVPEKTAGRNGLWSNANQIAKSLKKCQKKNHQFWNSKIAVLVVLVLLL
jgi:hypothetical protein